jgi:hypothetical protein
MPRGDFNQASKGGAGFVEGYVHVQRSVSKVYQYPPNSQTKEQSDPFVAMVWDCVSLTPEWKVKVDPDGNPETVEIIHRMGDLEKIRPGKLDPKDFDNVDVEPVDLESAVGVEGNSFYFEQGAKFGPGWAIMKESLEKHGYSPAIMGRCVATDFEGLMAHFKTEEGKPYIAQKGKSKGKEVKPTNLVCDRILPPLPYEKGAKKPTAATKAPAAAGAAGGKGNGAATEQPQTTATGEDVTVTVATLLNDLSEAFPIKKGQAAKRTEFQKALTMELLRKKFKPGPQKEIMDFVKSDDFVALGAATDLFTVEGDSITLT